MKAVLDTNVVVSALVFPGEPARLTEEWRSGRMSLFAGPRMVEEYARVLGYPKFRLDEATRARLLNGLLLPYLNPVVEFKGALPHPCRDPDDDGFLRAALGCEADWLVSGDADLLDLDGRYPFRILSPADALATLQKKTGPNLDPKAKKRPA